MTRILDLGLSGPGPSGVRDYGEGLTEQLRSHGHDATHAWLAPPGSQRAATAWLDTELERAVERRTEVIVWQYTPFAYGVRGLPTLAVPFARRLATAGPPVVAVLHELAFPWGRLGWRGALWASTQRPALAAVLRAAAGVVVTVDSRADWLRRRPWLPSRPTIAAPVFSNLPEHLPDGHDTDEGPGAGTRPFRVAVFSYPPVAIPLVVEAVRLLRAEVADAELWLLGSPGPEAPVSRDWQRAATEAGVRPALHFSGVLDGPALARTIADCDAFVFHDRDGPAPRKGSLAALLSGGRAVVAVDGPETWPELAAARAVVLVPPDAAAVARELLRLAEQPDERRVQGRRARDFYLRHSSREVVTRRIERLLDEVLACSTRC